VNPEEFEKQVERILRILEAEGASVTWNDRIPDPDNPAQLRQIDVSVRREGRLTLVECRAHSRPQDVKWIEELYGRRVSLGADSVIAVSASGFTEGAVRKANRLGVFARDLRNLSDEEIHTWGRGTRVRLSYVKFEEVDVFLVGSPITIPSPIHPLTMFQTSTGGSWPVGDLFQNAATQIANHNLPEDRVVRGRYFTNELFFGTNPIPELVFQAQWRWLHRDLVLPTVLAFGPPTSTTSEQEAYIERVDHSRTEIHHGSEGVVALIDVVAAHPLDGAFPRRVDLDLGQPLPLRGFGIIGIGEPLLGAVPFRVHFIAAGSRQHMRLLEGPRVGS